MCSTLSFDCRSTVLSVYPYLAVAGGVAVGSLPKDICRAPAVMKTLILQVNPTVTLLQVDYRDQHTLEQYVR